MNTKVAVKVTRKDNDGSGFVEKIGTVISVSPEKVFYPTMEAELLAAELRRREPGILVELQDEQ